MTASAFSFQISDFRFQIPSPRASRFLLSDFRFQISDPKPLAEFLFQISDFRFQISDRPDAEILLEIRSQNTQNTFQDYSSEFCWAQISDFRSQNSRGGREQISDFRFQISETRLCPATDFRFQISENKGAGLDPKGREISDFRFQISGVGCPLVWDVHCRFQISDFSAARGSGVSDFSVSDFRKHKSGPIGQEISIVCQGENQKKHGQIPKRNMLSNSPLLRRLRGEVSTLYAVDRGRLW